MVRACRLVEQTHFINFSSLFSIHHCTTHDEMFHNTVWLRSFYLSLSVHLSSLFYLFPKRASCFSSSLPLSRTASDNDTVGSHETDGDSLFLSRSQEFHLNTTLLCQVEVIGADVECIQRVMVLKVPAILLSSVGKQSDVSCKSCCCPPK